MDDNALLWRPETGRDHVESLFVKLNVPDQREAFWVQFGARTFQPGVGEPHAHVMAVRFSAADPSRHVARKQRFSRAEVTAASDRLHVTMGADNQLSTEGTHGQLSGGETSITWDLRFSPPRSRLRHLPWDVLYRLPLPRSKATSPALEMTVDGWYEVNGERTEVVGCPAMQGHNWGKEHAYRWAWSHSNHLVEEGGGPADAVFEGLSAKLKIGPLTTPWISLLHLRYGDEVFAVDTIRGPWSIQSDVDGLRWRFTGTSGDTRLEGVAEAAAERFVGVHYLLPSGVEIPCLNATIGALELRLLRRKKGAWQLAQTLRSDETAALELGGGDGHPNVPIVVD